MSTTTNPSSAPASGAPGGGSAAVPTGRAPKWLRAIFIANLAAQTGIVLTGGLVRLTGSGLGCPTWPECAPGSFVPTTTQEQAWHKYVEFGNRTLTFLLGILAIAAIVGAIIWARKLRRTTGISRRPIVLLAAIPLLGTVAQAVLGGITVLTGLNPASVSAHFMVSAALIAFTLLLVVRSRESGDQPITVLVAQPIRYLSRGIVAVALVVLTLGTLVTGSGPHSGDVNTVNRLPFDPRFISWLHADAVLLFIGLIVGLAVALVVTKASRGILTRTWWLLGICLAQGAIGYVQYFTGLPWLIVLVHLAGACAVWLAVLTVHFSLRRRGPDVAPAASVEPEATRV
ncbi:MAG: heme A synthase [Actinobacteria bacterium]|nr:heme A synthase [Actinomycetota bacterium]